MGVRVIKPAATKRHRLVKIPRKKELVLSGLANPVTKEEEFGAPWFAVWTPLNRDVDDPWAMERESPLDAFALNRAPHGEGLAKSMACQANDLADEWLDSLFLALTNEVLDAHEIADFESRWIFLHVLFLEVKDDVVHF